MVLVFDELSNGQVVMHYSRHRLTASAAYTTTNDQWARSACPLVISSKTKPCQFSSVQLRRSVRALKETREAEPTENELRQQSATYTQLRSFWYKNCTARSVIVGR